MADTVKKVEYFAVEAANKAGEGARILKALANHGVNLLAFSGFPSGRKAQLDFIPEKTAVFIKAAKKAGLRLKKSKAAFLVQGKDRAGATAVILAKLAAAKINVTAVDAVGAGKGRWGAILWVKPKDFNKAARALKAR